MYEKMVINKVEKLVPNLHDKKNYVIHIRALDQALKHGLILELVTLFPVVSCRLSVPRLDYIIFNPELRMKAKNDFEKTSLSL